MRDHDSLAQFLALPAIQRDLLLVLDREGPQYGLETKKALEARRQGDINNGQLYSNLDKLAAAGFIEKGKYTDRRNRYEIRERGERALNSYRRWMTGSQAVASPRPLQRLALLDAPGETDE